MRPSTARHWPAVLGVVLLACGGPLAAPGRAQDLAEQVRRLQEADRQRQAEIEQLKARNELLQGEVDRLKAQAPGPQAPAAGSQAAPAEGSGATQPGQDGAGDKDARQAAPAESKGGTDKDGKDDGGSDKDGKEGKSATRLLTAGYNLLGGAAARQDGFFIRNADDTFNLHVHNRLQMRYAYDHFFHDETRNGLPSFDRREDRSDFHIAREYLTLNGNAWTKDLYYQVTFEGFTAANEIARLRYAWVDYNLLHGLGWADDYSVYRNALTLRAGLWKGRFGREFPASDGQLQLVDRALATQAYNEGRVRGIEAHGSLVYFDEDRNPDDGKTTGPGRFAYYVEVIDSINNANQAFDLDNSPVSNPDRFPRQLDVLPTLTARLQYDLLRGWYTYELPGGKVTRANDFRFNEANDLAYHEEPALQVGGSYIFDPDNFDAQPADNPLQGRFFKGKNVQRYGADASFKYRGFSLTGEYYGESIAARAGSVHEVVNFATGELIPPEARVSQFSQGFYVRTGYFVIPRCLEVAGRVSGLFTNPLANEFIPAAGVPGAVGFRPARFIPGAPVHDAWEYTLGLGYYPTGHHYLKIQVDGSYVTHSPISAEKSEFLSATQESDLIVRAQLQVEF